jgi:integrase
MDEYLARQDLRPRSRDSYRAAIEAHLAGWLDRPLSKIDRTMIEARHADIAKEIEDRHLAKDKLHAEQWETRAKAAEARNWFDAAANYRARAAAALSRKTNGFATANGAMRALRALWNYAADRHPEIGTNPVKLRRQWHPVAPRERHLPEDDMAKFYKAAMALESPVGRDYILLLLCTGLRRREAAGLKWADVDLSAKVIRIPAAMTKAKRKLDLPMSDFVHDLLVARRAVGRDRNDYVFPAASRSGHIEEPRFFLDRIAKSCGVRISAHDLRRTFITVAESTNISPIALRALVNHSLGKDVTSGYVQMTPERLREPAQLVCNKLKLLCGIVGPEGRNVAKLKR